MKRIIPQLLTCLILVISCKQKDQKKLTIAVSANMQFAIKEISKAYTKQTGVDCEIIIGSSGKLTAQIKKGAPFDILVSADMKYPEELFTSGFTTNKPKIYAYGKLVLWTMIDSIKPALHLLKNLDVHHIAIANPKTAPYGIAAVEILKNKGIYSSINHKLVFGESISQTNQFIVSKSAEIGFTSKSVVLSPKMKNKGNWIDLDKNDYSPIAQGIVVLKNRAMQKNDAEKFYNFIQSATAKKILVNFGYSVK
ncbi:molybdate ABC transporter substrate-binding protein [Aquimarina muelleri]|nr:molybdate ABC transporter substrate-binding protein [Aquimarina muelleri]MCX2764040.1 molybdate ABC transporter substrate-binding protein [Aquimarina muelleri]